MNLCDFAKKELSKIDHDEDGFQDLMDRCIMELIETFAKQDHSNSTASYTLNIFERLARFVPLTPLTGDDDEWIECDNDGTEVNKRFSAVFRKGKNNSTAYNIHGKVFSNDGGRTFYSCYESRIPVTFPYYPPTQPERVILR